MLRTIFGLGKRRQNRLLSASVALMLVLAAPGWCHGGITNVRLYRLGEDDVPSAVPLGPGDNPTVDDISGINASKIGLEFYYGIGAPAVALGLAPGSTEAMEFTNVDSRYVASAEFLTDNFGMEVYIQVSPGVTDARAFYNGDGGFPFGPLDRGCGLGVSGGFYAAFVGGAPLPFLTSVPAVPLVPIAMALVNTGGGNFEVYIQKKLVLSFLAPSYVPPLPTDQLSLGNFVSNLSPPNFAGVLDEARVFTFSAGGFDPKTDLGEQAVHHHHHGHKGRGPH